MPKTEDIDKAQEQLDRRVEIECQVVELLLECKFIEANRLLKTLE